MSKSKISIFAQMLGLINRSKFSKVVKKHNTDKFSKGIDTWTHFVSMMFMQLADVSSLRDISHGIRSASGNLNHLGVTKAPSKSSLSYRNKQRTYKVFEDLYFELLESLEPSLQRRRQYASRLKRKIFIMDGSIIPLCLSLFNWAKFRTKKGAIKMHAVLDYDLGLPNYAYITDGKTHDINPARNHTFPPESVIVVDRAYVDFEWLNNLDSNRVTFVTRLKKNVNFEIEEELPVNEKHEHILSDQIIRLTGDETKNMYPGKIRVIEVYDPVNDQTLVLMTNNLTWTADTISQLYKARWDVEVFFRFIKQLFRVKTFVGTSPNAVRIQLWCSLIAMLLLKYLKNKAEYKWNLSNLVTLLRVHLFSKIDLWAWINKPILEKANSPPEITLFDQ